MAEDVLYFRLFIKFLITVEALVERLGKPLLYFACLLMNWLNPICRIFAPNRWHQGRIIFQGAYWAMWMMLTGPEKLECLETIHDLLFLRTTFSDRMLGPIVSTTCLQFWSLLVLTLLLSLSALFPLPPLSPHSPLSPLSLSLYFFHLAFSFSARGLYLH